MSVRSPIARMRPARWSTSTGFTRPRTPRSTPPRSGPTYTRARATSGSVPHAGAVVADPGLLESLRPAKLVPSADEGPERFEHGTASFEQLAGVGAAVDWIAGLTATSGSRRERVLAAMAAVERHLDELAAPARDGLQRIAGVRVLGRAACRTSTISFTVGGRTPDAVASALGERGVNVWAGDNYAYELMDRFGLGLQRRRGPRQPRALQRSLRRAAAARRGRRGRVVTARGSRSTGSSWRSRITGPPTARSWCCCTASPSSGSRGAISCSRWPAPATGCWSRTCVASATPTRPSRCRAYAIDVLAGDVLGLLDHAGAAVGTVIGHDWGADSRGGRHGCIRNESAPSVVCRSRSRRGRLRRRWG